MGSRVHLSGFHRLGKTGKILITSSSQGNQGKTGFSAKIREQNFKSGNCFSQTIFKLLKPKNMMKIFLRL